MTSVTRPERVEASTMAKLDGLADDLGNSLNGSLVKDEKLLNMTEVHVNIGASDNERISQTIREGMHRGGFVQAPERIPIIDKVQEQVAKNRGLPSSQTSIMIEETKTKIQTKEFELETLRAAKMIKIGEINDRSAERIARYQKHLDYLHEELGRIKKEITQYSVHVDEEEKRCEGARRECITFYDKEMKIAARTINSMSSLIDSLQATINAASNYGGE